MSYAVKEIFYSLQGEGARTGRPAVFLRFAGCNLWNGLESGRAEAVCRFCDTDFVGPDGPGGGKFASSASVARAVMGTWPATVSARSRPYVVCTGGEPALQLDPALIAALHAGGFEIAIETNGTLPLPEEIDWVCVSPKAEADLLVRSGDELKLVFPQQGGEPERYRDLDFQHFFLQPMDGPAREENTRSALEYCLRHPQWRLSLQTHKLLGIP
jgi:7-carboxy-7-deazaguanine synthase (Cx14CxxC type)